MVAMLVEQGGLERTNSVSAILPSILALGRDGSAKTERCGLPGS